MNIKLKYLLFFVVLSNVLYGQKYEGELGEIEYQLPEKKLDHIAQIIETKSKFKDFVDIKKGDVIGDIGSWKGSFIGVLSTLFDSVTFYAEDINAKSLSERKYKRKIKSYAKYRTHGETNTYKRIIGTERESKLPNNLFDKIFVNAALHDFDYKNEMITDISKKLNSHGQLIIVDGYSFAGDTIKCTYSGCHNYMIMDSLVKMCERNNLYLIKMRNPNFHASHQANMLVFGKDKAKSDEFQKKRNGLNDIMNKMYQFNKDNVASDTSKVNEIIAAALPKINEVTAVYAEYDIWLKELALQYLRELKYQSAINILKANVRFYPDLYQTYYWLGVAYQENKQYNLALKNFKLALSLNKNNSLATSRIKSIETKIVN